jgi:pimeloyl-ACP methyl ester carboxylesterase
MPGVVGFLTAEIPRFEVVTIPDAGHHAHRRAPGAFADLVRRGLDPG